MKRTVELSPDTVCYDYLLDDRRLSSQLNAAMFNGRQVIKPENISEWDSRETSVVETETHIKETRRFRDLIKKVTMDDGRSFLVGLENQQKRDRLMPIRSMEYTAQTLRKQIKKNPKDLMEVFLIVVFYGKNRWTKTYELSDLYEGIEEVSVYRNTWRPILVDINSFDLSLIKDQELRDSFAAIRALNQSRIDIESFQGLVLTTESTLFVAVVTGFTYLEELAEVYNGKEGIRMCEAIEKMKQEGKKEGKVETLIKQLTRKFKVLSEELIETVKQSSIERLEQLSEDIFDVQNEADVLYILSA